MSEMLNKIMNKLNTSKTTNEKPEENKFSSFSSAQPRKTEGNNTKYSTSGNNLRGNSSGNTWYNPWKVSGTKK